MKTWGKNTGEDFSIITNLDYERWFQILKPLEWMKYKTKIINNPQCVRLQSLYWKICLVLLDIEKLERTDKMNDASNDHWQWCELAEWIKRRYYNTCVSSMISSARPARWDHYIHATFVLRHFEKWTYGPTTRVKIMITTGQDCGSAEWIKKVKVF